MLVPSYPNLYWSIPYLWWYGGPALLTPGGPFLSWITLVHPYPVLQDVRPVLSWLMLVQVCPVILYWFHPVLRLFAWLSCFWFSLFQTYAKPGPDLFVVQSCPCSLFSSHYISIYNGAIPSLGTPSPVHTYTHTYTTHAYTHNTV